MCDLCVHSLWDFPGVVRKFVVNCIIGGFFFHICKNLTHSFVSLLSIIFMNVVGSISFLLGGA